MVSNRLQRAIASVVSLGEPVRRKLYEAVAASSAPLSRQELARRTGVARPLAAYHLDRLVQDGLLDTRFERQTGRSGPGAGRPAKLYFRPNKPVQVTLPPRDFELAARVLVEAAARNPDAGLLSEIQRGAREAGAALGREAGAQEEADEQALARLLIDRGYEPRTDPDGTTRLQNCVFNELASRERELVCNMNFCLISGMLDALPDTSCRAELDPAEGRCCVVLHPDPS